MRVIAADSMWGFAILGVVIALTAFGTLLLGIMHGVAQDRGFYADEYELLGTYEYVGMSVEDLGRVTDALLVYLEDADEEKVSELMYVSAVVHGELRQVFNEKEIAHMVDVRALYQKGLMIWFACIKFLIAGAAVLAVSLLRNRRAVEDRAEVDESGVAVYALKNSLRKALHGFWIGNGLVLTGLVLLAVYILSDFYGFWTAMHEMLFTNDLWLLDPREDIMIQIMQGDLFESMVLRMVSRIGLVWGAIVAAAVVGQFVLRGGKKRVSSKS